MKLLVLVQCLILTIAKDACDGSDWGTSGDFDFYVFQQSWSADFCKGSNDPGCVNPTPTMKTNLTIHGMWPNYNTEQSGHWWPQCCKSTFGQSMSQTVYQALKSNLYIYWPNEQDPQPTKVSGSLWDHEWGKHGTCSGLAQQDYFQSALGVDMALGTPSLISDNVGGQVSLNALESVYNGSPCQNNKPCKVALGCQSGSTLSDVTTCWSKGLSQIVCPVEVMQSSSVCTASSIQILSFSNGR